MTSSRRSIFPISFGATISIIAALDERAFSVVRDEIKGPLGFETDARRMARLAEAMDVDEDVVQAIIHLVGFMYEQIHRRADEDLSGEEIRDLVAREFDVEDGPEAERLYERLEVVLRRDQKVENYRRVRDIKTGFMPRATGFSSVLDLRPDMTLSSGGGIKLVPLLQFRIDTDADGDSTDCVVLQLDERALEELEQAVRDARERLNSLRDDPVLAPILAGQI